MRAKGPASKPSGAPEETHRRKGKSDFARLDALTDAAIAEAVADDPDAVPLDLDWSKASLAIPPGKRS
jgi:hypothetical protein